MVQLSFSQNTSIPNNSTSLLALVEKYPKKVLIDGDTLVLITIPQIRSANLLFVNGDFYKEMTDTLRVLTSKQQKAIVAEHNLILNYEQQLKIKKQIITSYDEVTDSYRKMEGRNDRQIKWLKIQRDGLGFLFGVAILNIFVFH